jgi:hypothetical protein
LKWRRNSAWKAAQAGASFGGVQSIEPACGADAGLTAVGAECLTVIESSEFCGSCAARAEPTDSKIAEKATAILDSVVFMAFS